MNSFFHFINSARFSCIFPLLQPERSNTRLNRWVPLLWTSLLNFMPWILIIQPSVQPIRSFRFLLAQWSHTYPTLPLLFTPYSFFNFKKRLSIFRPFRPIEDLSSPVELELCSNSHYVRPLDNQRSLIHIQRNEATFDLLNEFSFLCENLHRTCIRWITSKYSYSFAKGYSTHPKISSNSRIERKDLPAFIHLKI